MQARFILGPAGSGKTFRCLAEIRAALAAEPEGPPLLLLAPKQTTYQLERQLLAGPSLAGYTRLQILSLERLASRVFDQLQEPRPRLLGEEGRLMVLRSLLARQREELKLFRASARLTGFAQHLSQALRELQRHQMTPESLLALAAKTQAVEGLSFKLHDLATLLRDYLDWLAAHSLQDADHLPDVAAAALRAAGRPLLLGEIWVDGFTEFSPRELELLCALLPHTTGVTFTFCLAHVPAEPGSRLSNWSVVRRAYWKCREAVAGVPGCELATVLLPRQIEKSRFVDNPVLRHLEEHWGEPVAFVGGSATSPEHPEGWTPNSTPEHPEGWTTNAGRTLLRDALRVAACGTPEAEATLAAREILRFVRAGGRYREATVLTRNLDAYHGVIEKVFTRYEIPVFLDRRESVSHHPFAELTRNALRTVAFQWQPDDWFAALKTGLVPAAEADIDRLENEALARGWRGKIWQEAIAVADQPDLVDWLELVRGKVMPPFQKLAQAMAASGNCPSGRQLAAGLREFWETLGVEETLRQWSDHEAASQPIHQTVWEQMGAWLENVELAFPAEPLALREWLPILEVGLGNLSVGVIPPALDQVLIGAIDRSRNPDIKLALVLGMNETVFPATPKASVLLTDADRAELEKQNIQLGGGMRQQIGLERYYGYVACTRARRRLVLTYCLTDATDKPLNPSPFLSTIQQLFPALEVETFPRKPDWRKSEHISELIAPLLQHQFLAAGKAAAPSGSKPVVPGLAEGPGLALDFLKNLPALKPLRESLRHFAEIPAVEALAPVLAGRIYGPDLRTSVSRMEQFAACPFKFFVHSGLRAEERKLFELEAREKGNFQHEVLALFHEELKQEGRRWRDLTPAEARGQIKETAARLAVTFREGLLQSSDQNRFTARVLTESLQDFVETLVGWMREQYAFDPVEVELPFGEEKAGFPPWSVALGGSHRLLLHGRIDRIDVLREGAGDEVLCVVVDYKSSQKRLDPLLMEHGLQLQLPAYLNVLRHWPDPRPRFGVARLIPAGVFYVNLRGRFEVQSNRDDALADPDQARRLAYRHSGRFDAGVLDKLDNRPAAETGDQFNYRRKKDGALSGAAKEALPSTEFVALLDHVETALTTMGQDIYAGVAKVDPYRKGSTTACDLCDYRSICRIDLWSHTFRVLRKPEREDKQA